jgi:tetratricopeptide (TPR) repeat protein
VASLQRAVELRPGFATALRSLVDALEADGREADALIACRKLSRVADDPTERRYYSAKALAKERKLEGAETELRCLLVLGPRDPRTRPLLGEVLSQRGMFEEAARYLAEAIDEVPNCFLHLTAVKRMTEADRPLLERMQAVAERPDLAATPRISVHFGLGKAFEDLGEYATAIRHYDTGNRIKGGSQRLNRAALVSQYDSTIAAFSAEGLEQAAKKFARPVSPGDDMPVFVVGMPCSGTTLTEQILSSHPAVAAGGELTLLRMRIAAWRAARIGALMRKKWRRRPKTTAGNCVESGRRR